MQVIFDKNGAVRELVICCIEMEKKVMKKLTDDGVQDNIFLMMEDKIIYNRTYINYCPWCGAYIETTRLNSLKMRDEKFEKPKYQSDSCVNWNKFPEGE